MNPTTSNSQNKPPSLPSSTICTNNDSNELPTPPSVPLCDPSAFPNPNKPPPRVPAQSSNPSLPSSTANFVPTAPPRTRPPPPPHFNKYYPYHHPIAPPNAMYNSYPIPNNYPPYTHYPSYPPPPVYRHPPNTVNPYPTFNGITAKAPTPPNTSSTQPSNPTPHTSQNTSNRSSPKTVKKNKPNPPKINPTYRPFYAKVDIEDKPPPKKNKNKTQSDTEQDTETDVNDSDYDPNTPNDGKKRSKKTKKKRKKHTKKKSKKHDTSDNILYLASQTVVVTHQEGLKPIKALTWREFRDWLKYNLESFDHQHMDRKRQRQLFTAKMNRFLSFCSKIEICNDGHAQLYYALWLQIPQKKEKWIQLLISDGGWFTNCTSEQQMMGYVTKTGDKDYWFFRVLEGQNSQSNIVLLLRCDKGGNCGELVWLQKGQNVSGTDALAIENALSSALDLRWVYLHDDSKIKYTGNSSRCTCHLYLKTIRSIAKGQSWYAQALYRPFNCKGWPSQTSIDGKTQTGVEPGTIFTQNAQEYKHAVHVIRSFKLKTLRKELILNTDFSKSGDKTSGIIDQSDVKKLDEVLCSMNEYDPYFVVHGAPSRNLNDPNGVNPSYFISFSDEEDVGRSNTRLSLSKRSLRRSKRDVRSLENVERDRKLLENNRICRVYRWHRRKIRIKCNKNGASESLSVCEYRTMCHTVGDLAAVLYHEGNTETWGDSGLKLIRLGKENLIKFFQHILTSAESKDFSRLTPQFAAFESALKTIEDTKIFGKRSNRWHTKQKQSMQQQKQQKEKEKKLIKPQRAVSTEPLYDIAMERQRQYMAQAQAHAAYHHWSFRGGPPPPMNRIWFRPPTVAPPQYNRALRNELAGDAHKLKMKEMAQEQKLYHHKMKLQKDLDSHLMPTTTNSANNPQIITRHKLLFESLKGRNSRQRKTKRENESENELNNESQSDETEEMNIAMPDTAPHNKVFVDLTVSSSNIDEILDVFDQIKTKKKTSLSGNKRKLATNTNNTNKRRKLMPQRGDDTDNTADTTEEDISMNANQNQNDDDKWCRYCGSKSSSAACWKMTRNKLLFCNECHLKYQKNIEFQQQIDGFKSSISTTATAKTIHDMINTNNNVKKQKKKKKK